MPNTAEVKGWLKKYWGFLTPIVISVIALSFSLCTFIQFEYPQGLSTQIKDRLDDVYTRIERVDAEIKEMRNQGKNVTELEDELNKAKSLHIDANHQWQHYEFDKAQENLTKAEQKVYDLERNVFGAPLSLWIVGVIIGAALIIMVVVSMVFRK